MNDSGNAVVGTVAEETPDPAIFVPRSYAGLDEIRSVEVCQLRGEFSSIDRTGVAR